MWGFAEKMCWYWSRWQKKDRVLTERYPGVPEERGHVWKINIKSQDRTKAETICYISNLICLKSCKWIDWKAKKWGFPFEQTNWDWEIASSKFE